MSEIEIAGPAEDIHSTDVLLDPEELKSEFLTFEQIAAADDITVKTVEIPEWNGKVQVKSLTKRQFDLISKRARNEDGELDQEKLEMMIFCTGMVNPKLTAEQYEHMRDRSMRGWARIYDAIGATTMLGEGDSAKAEQRFPGGS